MNRVIPTETKVKVMQESLSLSNVAEIADRYGVSPGAIYFWFNQKVKPALGEVLKNDPPGPEAQPRPETPVIPVSRERPGGCSQCGGSRIWKNGTYWVINWVWLLSMGWLVGLHKVAIQRWRCAGCGQELVGVERQRQAEARQAWWQQVKRMIGLSRFKLGLSIRKTQSLVAFAYGRPVSLGCIQRQTQRVGRRAQAVLERLNSCRQKGAHFLLYDETFPKLGKRVYSLGVVICEYGLIRSVRTLRRKAREIPDQLRQVVGEHYQPQYCLTDLEVTYAEHLKRSGLSLTHLRDMVHVMRQIARLFDEAVKEVTLDVPKGLPHLARQKQRQLKQRLLRKHLKPLLATAFKAFAPGYESVCVLMLEGVVSQLRDPDVILQTESVRRLARRMERFAKKHGPTLNTLMEMAVKEGTPKTTNSLESKNALFKPFSRIAKSFRLATAEHFFAGVALMENFDVKSRGIHQATSAIQRAAINLDDLGATDFFSAVGLDKPQISPTTFTI
jgi:CRISPR/Cas system CSM-associated protein Csm2 small subunit